MALEGTLEDFSLADIFQLIALQRKTGILALKRNNEVVSVRFHNGMVIGADSSPKKLEDRIGKVLEKTGLISEDQLREALEYQQKTLQKIGFILVDQNYITREQLQEALQIQVSQMIYRLFRWNRGEYYFDQKAKVDLESDENIPPMSAESILMEGIQMIDEWPIIEKKIPNFNMVFQPTIELSDIDLSNLAAEDAEFESAFAKVNAFAPPPTNTSEQIRLSREEAEVFLLVDGKNTVNDVVESSKLGEFHTCKALYDLLERKIVQPVGIRQDASAPSLTTQHVPEPSLVLQEEEPAWNPAVLGYPVVALLALAALWFTYRDPLRVAMLPFVEGRSMSQIQKTGSLTRIHAVDSAVVLYYRVNGALPGSLDDLVEGNYITEQQTVDSWSRPFGYQASDNTYTITGYTEDGKTDEGLQVQRTLEREPVPAAANP